MSWIQENKFVAGLAGVTAVVGGAIFFFGNSQGNAYDEKMLAFEELQAEHLKLEKAKPYPDAANLEERKKLIEQYRKVIGDVREALVGYQPGKLEQPTPQQFSDIQVKMQTDLQAAFLAAGTTLPEGVGFGFEKYAETQPKASATARLNFELSAMKWLLLKLAETKPQELINIRREELAVEKGAVSAPPQPTRRRGRGANRNNNRPAAPDADADEKPYVLMPVELSFTTTENSLRNFLKEMANSQEFYYAVRAIRIRNEKQTAPTINDANFPAFGGGGAVAPAPAVADPFGGFDLPDADGEGDEGVPAPGPVEPKVADGERILKQVLGAEKLNVYLSFDILLIKGDKPATEPTPVPSEG